MDSIQYIGERLWVGQIGHFFLLLSFVSAGLSALSYFLAERNRSSDQLFSSWFKLGKFAFWGHGISFFIMVGLIFYAMVNHMYEYNYVFEHVSDDLPMQYILSAFWEGQEGSFMLWGFWNIMLGLLMFKYAGNYKAPVLFIIVLAQFILVSMLLGFHIPIGDGEYLKLGSNPTALLREVTDAPIFSNADYLSLIKGRGLNPLLQNYWNVIHPPTTFLGYASTIVPFGFAFAGLLRNDHKDWMTNAMPWALFSAGILGTGILMGSLWAYVALSFGGYWAWDPVENASLVPWITMVAGIHVHLVNKTKGYATKSHYFFYLLSFILILYSSYLTKSGILGDTSAHAFTSMGFTFQLIFTLIVFITLGFGLFLYRFNALKVKEPEDLVQSREFWMFIGSLILFFSAVLIITSTSLPVINKIIAYFSPGYEGRVITEPVPHYNKYQLWIAVFISVLSSVSIYLRYRGVLWESQKSKLFIKFGIQALLSIGLTALLVLWIKLPSWQYVLLAFTSCFGVVANLDYMISVLKGNIKTAYAAFAHLGFSLMVLGILSSGLNQRSISSNPFVFKGMFNEEEDEDKMVQLIRGKPLFSQGYLMTYESDTLIQRERKYTVKFQKLSDSMEVVDQFYLYPNAVYANDFSKIAALNPDTKHQLHQDIFTCVVGLPPSVQSAEDNKAMEDSLKYERHAVKLNDSIKLKDWVIVPKKIHFDPQNEEYKNHTHDAGLAVHLELINIQKGEKFMLESSLGLEGALMYNYPASNQDAAIRVKLNSEMFDAYFTEEEELVYKDYVVKAGETFDYNGNKITLSDFDKNPSHPNYQKEEGDIAIGALLNIYKENKEFSTSPVYFIRKNVPMSLKSYIPELGIHIRFSNIDPNTEEFSFKVASDNRKDVGAVLDIASNVPRNDYIILQATVFPGINLFWGGSILMMLALFMAAAARFPKMFKK